MKRHLIILLFLIGFSSGCSESSQSDQKARIASDSTQPNSNSNPVSIMVYKSPTCGCCSQWEQHLRKAGFDVITKLTQEMTKIKQQYRIPMQLRSCHTALVDGYVIEGHVPASDIRTLLKQRPSVVGLTAPGMPQESPGMQSEGLKPANYDVLNFDNSGKTTIFSSY